MATTYVLGDQAGSQRLINVYVANGADGFTTSGGGDSSADLRKSLQHKQKTLKVVDDASAADVVVRVTSRNEQKELGSVTTYKNKSGDGKSETATTVPTQNVRRIVHATIKAGDFETDLEGENIFWSGAADSLAGQIDRWVKQNYPRLLAKRAGTSAGKETAQNEALPPNPTTATPASTPSDVALEPGMTPGQVTEKMGEPLKKVKFGAKSLWTYKGCQVVFEDDKVTDVKF
jgi:hypothetical protein